MGENIRAKQCEIIFPELKESEDERIRKELISFLQSYDTLLTQKFIAWLEKQSEQKSTWSEEDEYILNETIQHLKELIEIDKAKHCACDVQYYQRDIDWLKSLKNRIKNGSY